MKSPAHTRTWRAMLIGAAILFLVAHSTIEHCTAQQPLPQYEFQPQPIQQPQYQLREPQSVLVNPPREARLPNNRQQTTGNRQQTIGQKDRLTKSETDKLQTLITSLARDYIPHTYEDNKKWGKQAERWDGLKWERDGFKIETRARKKMVNHGRWTKYKATLVNPDQKLRVEVEEVRRDKDDKIEIQLLFVAKINLEGRMAKWVKGVQMYNIGADAVADVGLRVKCALDTSLDFTKLPPDLVVTPEVTDAELHIVDFNLIRISKIGGEVADQLGRNLKSRLQEEVDKREHKLVKSANKSIAKQQDKLRLSIADLVSSPWADQAAEVLPEKTVAVLKQQKDK